MANSFNITVDASKSFLRGNNLNLSEMCSGKPGSSISQTIELLTGSALELTCYVLNTVSGGRFEWIHENKYNSTVNTNDENYRHINITDTGTHT